MNSSYTVRRFLEYLHSSGPLRICDLAKTFDVDRSTIERVLSLYPNSRQEHEDPEDQHFGVVHQDTLEAVLAHLGDNAGKRLTGI